MFPYIVHITMEGAFDQASFPFPSFLLVYYFAVWRMYKHKLSIGQRQLDLYERVVRNRKRDHTKADQYIPLRNLINPSVIYSHHNRRSRHSNHNHRSHRLS